MYSEANDSPVGQHDIEDEEILLGAYLEEKLGNRRARDASRQMKARRKLEIMRENRVLQEIEDDWCIPSKRR